MDGVDVCVMAWCQTFCHCQCLPHQPIPQWSATVQCVSKPLCCCHFNQCVGAAVFSHFFPHCPIPSFSLVIGFGDGAVVEQPSHPCFVIHNTVCHVTPCVFLSSESWLKQCAFMKCLLCLWSEWIHRKSICLCKKRPQWFHKSAQTKCT